ncbi:DNA-directed RNA polymerase [Salvia divinorum]|uniref:DNA-directed RNA polymerase n=1 Tax=Salvia divinorum TaxID=28513 RepID=A0ABD1GVA5_SALDI
MIRSTLLRTAPPPSSLLIFLNSLLVTPNSARVREFGQRITVDETTEVYRKLFEFRGTPNELSARVLERYKLSKASKVSTSVCLKFACEISLN